MTNRISLFVAIMLILTGSTLWARQFAVTDAVADILAFNKPQIEANYPLFKHKMSRMAESPFAFLRGTAHLMNSDLNKTAALEFMRKSPIGLVAGDLHMHNFSVHREPGHQPAYVPDDHDEAFSAAPLSFDVFRLCVSLAVGLGDRLSRQELTTVFKDLFKGYKERAGDAGVSVWPDAPMSELLAKFVKKYGGRDQKRLIAKECGKKTDSFDYNRHEPVAAAEKKVVATAMNEYLESLARHKRIPLENVQILDISQRNNKGLSSLGLKRYFLLLRGDSDSWKTNHVIEVKLMRKTSVNRTTYTRQQQDTIESMVRAYLGRDPYLGTVKIAGRIFLVRQMYPYGKTLENIDIKNLAQARELAHLLGWMTADYHAHSKQGQRMKTWLEKAEEPLMLWIFSYTDQLLADYKVFTQTEF